MPLGYRLGVQSFGLAIRMPVCQSSGCSTPPAGKLTPILFLRIFAQRYRENAGKRKITVVIWDNSFRKVSLFCKDSSSDQRPRGTWRWRGLTHWKVTRRGWYTAEMITIRFACWVSGRIVWQYGLSMQISREYIYSALKNWVSTY